LAVLTSLSGQYATVSEYTELLATDKVLSRVRSS